MNQPAWRGDRPSRGRYVVLPFLVTFVAIALFGVVIRPALSWEGIYGVLSWLLMLVVICYAAAGFVAGRVGRGRSGWLAAVAGAAAGGMVGGIPPAGESASLVWGAAVAALVLVTPGYGLARWVFSRPSSSS